jgi:nucleoside phosphorylase
MAGHKVVIAILPHDEYGTTTAATVATDMLHSFPHIKVGLMIGVGGGAPTTNNDIRLGDVVVSSPKDGKSDVYQYDYGKRVQGQTFKSTGHLNQPPPAVLTVMALLVSRYKREGNQIGKIVNAMLEKRPRLKKEYGRPKIDVLYASSFIHPHGNDRQSCDELCAAKPPNVIHRVPREEDEDNPAVHFGTIASGNSLMKDAVMRDSLASEGVLCFEMEAAGLANRVPCLVVRGICDYSDSHKNNRWQGYAAMTAAAYTKDLLGVMLPKRVESEMKLTTVLESRQYYLMTSAVSDVSDELQSTIRPHLSKSLLRALNNNNSKHNISGRGCYPRIHRSILRKLWNDVIRAPVDGCSMVTTIVPGERYQVPSSGYMACLAEVRPFLPLLSSNSYKQKILWA